MPSPIHSGFRAFSSLVVSMSGVESLYWTPRFVWVNHCEHAKPVRLTRSRLVGHPRDMNVFKVADAVTEQGRAKK